MLMQFLVAGLSGIFIYLSFYLGVKVADKWLKISRDSKWRNFIGAVIGFIILITIIAIPLLFMMPE